MGSRVQWLVLRNEGCPWRKGWTRIGMSPMGLDSSPSPQLQQDQGFMLLEIWGEQERCAAERGGEVVKAEQQLMLCQCRVQARIRGAVGCRGAAMEGRGCLGRAAWP